MVTTDQEHAIQQAVEEILNDLIDEWYENVSGFYLTQEQLALKPGLKSEAELKRFHDEKGHRIKFNKDELDFTYGLRSRWQGDRFTLEVSVNNKVDGFDYDEFQERLLAHYKRTGEDKVPTPYELRTHCYRDIFQCEPNLKEAFTVERRPGKADIMRLTFRVNDQFLAKLISHPIAGKRLIENYCISPFRTVYAKVYRRPSR